MIFDLLMSEYGWTAEYIWKLTEKEVEWMVYKITDRQKAEAKFQAALAGKKLKNTSQDDLDVNFSGEHDKKIQEAMEKRFGTKG